MPGSVDFYYDFGSPTSYLAYTQMPGIARRTGAVVHYHPVLLGGIFQGTGNASPMHNAAKAKWMAADVAFFAQRYGVPYRFNPHFPINTLQLMRGAVHAQREGFQLPYADAIYHATWAEGLNTGDSAVVADVLAKAGLDARAILAGTQLPEVKAQLKDDTERAVKQGMFGLPVMVVGDRLFFGQDRLPYVEELLR